jgi:hypothetical protein
MNDPHPIIDEALAEAEALADDAEALAEEMLQPIEAAARPRAARVLASFVRNLVTEASLAERDLREAGLLTEGTGGVAALRALGELFLRGLADPSAFATAFERLSANPTPAIRQISEHIDALGCERAIVVARALGRHLRDTEDSRQRLGAAIGGGAAGLAALEATIVRACADNTASENEQVRDFFIDLAAACEAKH